MQVPMSFGFSSPHLSHLVAQTTSEDLFDHAKDLFVETRPTTKPTDPNGLLAGRRSAIPGLTTLATDRTVRS